MALPNSTTYDNDQLATSAWKYSNDNFINLLTKEGEKLLPALASKGRIFAVPDTEQMSDTFFYAAPGDETYTGVAPSAYGTGATLGVTSAEFQSEIFFTHKEWQNNVIWPTTEVAHPMNMAKRVRVKRAVIFNREEALLIRGATTLTGTYAINAPHSGDTDYSAGTSRHPMSLLSLYATGCAKGGQAGTTAGDKSAETFAGVKEDDTSEWAPTVTAANAANGSDLLRDFTKAIANASYGAAAPNFGLTGLNIWEYVSNLQREYGALPQPMSADLVKDPTSALMIGGIPLIWSRYLADSSSSWNFATGVSATANYPILLLDLNSLRMNVPAGGGEMGGEGLQFIRKISGVQVQEQQTQSFYRICAKRSYSIDGGRRSFGAVSGVTL